MLDFFYRLGLGSSGVSGDYDVDSELDDLDRDLNSLDEADEQAEDDYLSIVNSSKYADSNSNTKELEKLLSLLGIKCENDADLEEEENGKGAITAKIANIICHDSDEVLPGQPCYQPARFGKEGGRNFNLRKFDLPRWVMNAMKSDEIHRLRLDEPLSMNNYVERFQTLLWVEEAQQAIEMRRYDMYDVMLAKKEDFFLLDVPGLAEGRPSLLRGDRVVLTSPRRDCCYEGYIHDVREKDILFKLHENLHSTAMDGLRFNVQFLQSRTPFRRCHHGVNQLHERRDAKCIVFPFPRGEDSVSGRAKVPLRETNRDQLQTFNDKLNVYQKQAVWNVLKARSRPAPYIIFGPPGTGKTVTLVEAVLQVYSRRRDIKILVCANSNSSADICATRIKDSGVVRDESELLRVSAFYRMEKLIPPELESITKDMDMIDVMTYEKSRIVVTTCIQAGSLYEFRDLFDYIFIDEAGHACEPEIMITLGLLARDGLLVLAGDPHQLGPICVSRLADEKGLGLSMLERLCKRSVYQRNKLSAQNKMDYNEMYITKLRICYRCDARVLSISNKLFYNNDLKFVNETPAKWMKVLNVDFPLIFHSVRGRDRRERSNPSWFNPNESIRCLSYAKRLYDSGLKPEQLGIITPYRRQIDKIELLFDSCRLPKCKIATMEEFQGDEREVIIISTVRTRERKLEFDKRFNLGFLFNPRRFNVALSRAKWMVIVVGEETLLSHDELWSLYMREAIKFEDKQ